MIFPFDIINWFVSGVTGAGSDVNKAIGDFFKGIAGQIAAGLEAAGLSIIKDIWDVVVGPIEIFAGVLLFVIALGILFRNDVAGLAMAVMR